MPSIVTHHLFAKDCLKGYEKKVNKDVYSIFAQSFDNLAYYHFFTGFNNKVKMAGKIAQSTKTNEYFINLLNYIRDNDLKNDKEVIGYLFGSICHYALDSTCHPFVVYETGSVNIHPKYRGGHEKMEVMIDAIMYEEKEHKPLYKESLSNVLLPKIKFTNNLKDTINYTFNKTFELNMKKLLKLEILF